MMSDELVKALRNCSDCYCGDCKYKGLMQPGNCVKCMNKLIDDAADEMLRLQKENNDLYEIVQDLLKQLHSRPVMLLPDLPRWISVSERLPEKALPDALPEYPYSNWMLIYFNGGKKIEFARYHIDEKEWHDDFGEVVTGVTHYMTLPEPPRESE